MTPYLAIIVAALICYLVLPKGGDGLPAHIEADFDRKKLAYEAENHTEVEKIEDAEIVQNTSDQICSAPSLAIPADLVQQVEHVKIDGKWRSVVDISFITVLPKQINHD